MGDTIVGVQFGIANPENLLKRSVVEVITDKTYQNNQPIANGVFDARFGVIENGKVCPTCKQTNQFCPGHFGHIRLARPVYLYQFFDMVEKLANVICLNCSKILAPEEDVKALKSTGLSRFKEVRDMRPSPKKDEPFECPHCETPIFKKIAKVMGKAATLEGQLTDAESDPVNLQAEMILRAFQRITDDDCRSIGLNPEFARPEWMMCTVLAVPPLTVRPSVVMDDNQRMEDDLTHVLINILRANDKIREKIDKGESAEVLDKYTALLQYHVATYVDNDIKGMDPSAQRSGRPLRTLKSRFGAKTGRVRGNLMGKRVDFSARSVITPDANIELDELGVPEEIATNLTFPEIVSPYNRDRLLSYVKNGPDKHPGAKSVYLKADDRTVSLRYVNPDTIDIREGDVVHRHLINGDIVLFNRQPSLHKASMMAHRIVVLPYSTFRLNVSATRPYNADFDGDEMNMHVPQSIASATELRYIASVLRNIISPRTNSPIIQLFQDTMTGAYRISQPGVRVPEPIAMNILARLKLPFVRKNTTWTGAELISAAFPVMNYKGRINLKNGQLEEGNVLQKGGVSGLLHVIYADFGPQRAGQLINDIQSIVTQYNLYTGFSVGTSDLIANQATREFVAGELAKGRDRVAKILSAVHAGQFENLMGLSDGEQLEDDISSALKEVAASINTKVIGSLDKANRIVQMVDSGSKGGEQNITQMVALLGQQLIEGKRVQYTLQDRTLPHFARYDDGVESRGFVQHSFVDGLMPAEFFYHAQAGREGLIDTAVKTSDTGYIQRRLMKSMEDQHVEHDGTVRNVTGSVIQFSYGEDGVDTVAVESQTCELPLMTLENIYRDYALTPSDVNPFLTASVEETPDLVEDLVADRDLFVKSVFRYRKNDTVLAPVNLKRLLTKYANSYSTKTDLTPAHVVGAINRFIKEFPQSRVFHALLRFYLAPKKVIVVHRLSLALFDELIRDVRFRYIKSLVHAGEMVGALAAQSIGEPTTQLTLNSIAHDERVWVKNGACVRSVRIGDFVQEWIAKSSALESHPNNTTLAHMPDGWETMSVDENGVIEWRKLEAVTQHPPVNEDGSNTLVKIHTKGGRTVLATKAKSFLTKGTDGLLVPTRGDELTIGCQVPLMANMPLTDMCGTVDVFDWIERGYRDRLPETIVLDEVFGRFVGAYIAEGMANEHVVGISNNDETFRTKALEWVDQLGFNYKTTVQENKIKTGWTSTDTVIHCSQLARFMAATCGRGSANKQVPSFAYTAPEEFVTGLLSGYLSGDGTVGKDGRRCINFTSISEQLVDGMNALLARIGVHARKSREMKHRASPFKTHSFWFSRIPVNECIVLRTKMSFIVPEKQTRFEAITPTTIKCVRSEFTRVNNIIWDTVVSIEEQGCPTPFVYDFTVEGTRNFVHANGLCLRDTFHSAGTAKANATSGVPRLEEILSASANPKRPGNTVYLAPEFAYDQDAVISKMKEIQRTTLRDITKSVRIYYDPSSSGTVVEEDAEVLALYQEFTVANVESCKSPWIMRLELNDLEMASRNILDLTEVQTKLRASPYKILECMHSVGDSAKGVKADAILSNADASKLILRLTFDENVVKTPTQLRFLEDKILDTVLTGVDGVGGVHLRKVKNELIYDEKVGGYSQKEQYVLDVDGTNMYQLMVFPGADGTRTFSNDIHEINDVFGIEAARLAIFEECSEVFVQEKVNYHHLSVLVDSMTFSGRIVAVNRFGMNKNETGVLARSSFEETSKNMFNAAMGAEYDTMRGVSANIMFGQKPPCGTGFVDILVDESRLPDGPDELPEDKTLDEVNQKLSGLPTNEIQMADIQMAW
jgi:DNA-directed RNA polymerase beta' subunit